MTESPRRKSKEQLYFDALKRIASYSLPSVIRRRHSATFDPLEEIEMAYENVIFEARNAVGRRKRPSC